MTLSFVQKNVFGRILFYPINELATSICRVASQKSLPKKDLLVLQEGGFIINVQVEQIAVFGKNADAITETKGE